MKCYFDGKYRIRCEKTTEKSNSFIINDINSLLLLTHSFTPNMMELEATAATSPPSRVLLISAGASHTVALLCKPSPSPSTFNNN